jgi:Mor family transcriptional regulator
MMSMAWKGARNVEIEKLHSEGASYAALARQFELSPSRVQQIIANTRRMRKRLQARLDAPLRHPT